MRRVDLAVLATAAILVLALVLPATSSATDSGKRYVVMFSGDCIPRDAARTVVAAGGKLVTVLPEVGIGIAVSDNPDFAALLNRGRGVIAVGEERFMPFSEQEAPVDAEADALDPGVDTGYFAYQWDIRRVRADQAWSVSTGSHDTVVAVIDTGVAWNHPDLAPNVAFHFCYSAVTGPCLDYPSLSYHGTHVAGTIAAAFGGGKAVGVGPNLGLASYNVVELTADGLVAYDSAIWQAMLDAARRGFKVINLSLGGYMVSTQDGHQSEDDARDAHGDKNDVVVWAAWNRVVKYVTRKGVTIVAAAGNNATDLKGPVAHIPSDLPAVIGVGGTAIRPDPVFPLDGSYDVLAEYSNYGAPVTLVAPGGDTGPEGTPLPFPGTYYLIYSTYVRVSYACALTGTCPTRYAFTAGTSMAAPHVAGVAGLLIDREPWLNPHQVAAILKQTAEPLGDRQLFGHGMVDAAMAVGKGPPRHHR